MNKKRYTIDLPDAVVEVFNEGDTWEKGMGYIHDGYVFIYRGKKKKSKALEPASVYLDENKNPIWIDAPEDIREEYSAERIIPLSKEGIYEEIQEKANLKEIDSRLIEESEDAFIVLDNKDDDVLKSVVKNMLRLKQVSINAKDTTDPATANMITNMKSNLKKDGAKVSINYFQKWLDLLEADGEVVVKFTDANGDPAIIRRKLNE
jgi:hypothetical protein